MKKTYLKKTFWVCLILVAAMILPLFGSRPSVAVTEAEAKTFEELEKELEAAQQKYNAKEAERKAAEKRRQEYLKQLGETTSKLQELDVQYSILEEEQDYISAEMEITQFLLDAYKERQDYYQSLIDEQNGKLEETLELYATVLRYKYENGSNTSIEILFNSKDFEQFLSRVQYFDNIIEYNDTIAQALDKIEKELHSLQDQYNSALDNLSYYTDMLDEQQAEIDEKQAQMDALKKELEETYNLQELRAKQAEHQEEELAADAEVLKEAIDAAKEAILNYQNNLSAFGWPLKSGVWYYITSYFGWRDDPLGRGWKHHSGLDIAAGGGNAVLAVCDGVVTTAKWHNSYGYYVVIYHGEGVSSLYAHMQKGSLAVKVGDNVKRGQQIGKVGSTGDSTGNHLHFSVLVNGSYLNPDNYLPDGYYVKKFYPAEDPRKK